MEEHKETRQEFHESGEMKSHTEIKQYSQTPTGHSEIVNMTISVIMAITSIFFCSIILIGAMSVIMSMLNQPRQEQSR